jgi:hypothetical protein
MSINDWIAHLESDIAPTIGIRRAGTFDPLSEKHQIGQHPRGSTLRHGSVRDLPFSQKTFEFICKKFQVHESILRAVSRSDVPMLSCEPVNMKHSAFGKPSCTCFV